MTVVERIKADPRVVDVSDERGAGDGYWVYLDYGWYYEEQGSHIIHEDTPTQCLRLMKFVKWCGCEDCINVLHFRALVEDDGRWR